VPKRTTPEIVTAGVREHRAVQAWLQVHAGPWEPGSLEVLQGRRYSTVYRLNHSKQGEARVIAKRCRTATARMERMIYQQLLPLTGLPALSCYGLLEEPGGQFSWLFLEDAAGRRYSPLLPEHRTLAGRWLGEIQLVTGSADLKRWLPQRELDYYRQLLCGCQAMLLDHLNGGLLSSEDGTVLHNIAAHLDVVESLWREIEETCAPMPPSLVHGDFVIKNLRICDTVHGPAILVFDWEFAGWGSPVIDLAQFIDRTASPELSRYCSILQREHSHLNLCDIQAAAACGNLLRLVNQISWATAGQESIPSTQLIKTIALLRSYESTITAALSAFGRSRA
jgi:phosphotransferase family enzyme